MDGRRINNGRGIDVQRNEKLYSRNVQFDSPGVCGTILIITRFVVLFYIHFVVLSKLHFVVLFVYRAAPFYVRWSGCGGRGSAKVSNLRFYHFSHFKILHLK